MYLFAVIVCIPTAVTIIDLLMTPRPHPTSGDRRTYHPSDTAFGKVPHRVDQMNEGPAELVEFPDDQNVTSPQRPEACFKARVVIADTGGAHRLGDDCSSQRR